MNDDESKRRIGIDLPKTAVNIRSKQYLFRVWGTGSLLVVLMGLLLIPIQGITLALVVRLNVSQSRPSTSALRFVPVWTSTFHINQTQCQLYRTLQILHKNIPILERPESRRQI